jgi:hypothetical protein
VIHGFVIHKHLEDDHVLLGEDEVHQLGQQIMPSKHLHGGEHSLAEAPPAGVELEHVQALLKLEWCVLAIASAEEAEVLVEDGVPGGELCGPSECHRLVLLLPREAVEHGADQETDARDLDGELVEELHPRLGAAGAASAATIMKGSNRSASAGAVDSSEETTIGTGMPSNSSSSERLNTGVGFGGPGVEGLGFGMVVVTGGEVSLEEADE